MKNEDHFIGADQMDSQQTVVSVTPAIVQIDLLPPFKMKQFSKTCLQPWGIAIVESYPLVFLEKDETTMHYATVGSVTDSDVVNLRYGFECGEGWADIIKEIAKKATEIITYLRTQGDNQSYIHSCIVKEKFGGLRWQGDHNLPPVFYDLWMAFVTDKEGRSLQTCEVTGRYGSLRIKKINGAIGWNRTLCEEKAIELGYQT